jgi:alanyl-tRNA synthetase
MTPDEVAKVEAIVNEMILAGEAITTVETDIESAKKMGATALFGEKYGATVRVVKMGDFSTEFCGGTHQDNTAKIGLFKIISESGVAAGTRRIEGTTGKGVLELYAEKEALIRDTAKELKVGNVNDIAKKATQLQSELSGANKEINALNAKIAASKTDDILKNVIEVGSLKLITAKTEGVAVNAAREICDNVKANMADTVIVLSCSVDGKHNFVCACGKDAVAAGAHAGNILKTVSPIAGGNGGGRPDSATSGAKDEDKIQAALDAVKDTLSGMIK